MFSVDILGDKALSKKFNKLELNVQKKVIRPAQRKLMKKVKQAVVAAVPVDTGELEAAMGRQKVKASKRSRSKVGMEYGLPTRDELGIPADATGYPPAVVEYGRDGVPAQSFIRVPSDGVYENGGKDQMARDIGKGIEKEALKK